MRLPAVPRVSSSSSSVCPTRSSPASSAKSVGTYRTPAASRSKTSLRNGSRENCFTALRIAVTNCRVVSSVRATPTTANRSGRRSRYASE